MQDVQSTTPASLDKTLQAKTKAFWPERWWGIVDYKIGIIPLPVFLLLFAVIGTTTKKKV